MPNLQRCFLTIIFYVPHVVKGLLGVMKDVDRGSGVRLDWLEGGRKMSSGCIFGYGEDKTYGVELGLLGGRKNAEFGAVELMGRSAKRMLVVEVTHRLTNDSATVLLSDELNSILKRFIIGLLLIVTRTQNSYYRNNG
ncbi:hypothetical protein H5410_023570 [Solanum commersonii]|uniref:Uncharacterized protein n=1 Tax=Solanum commersonii TaxID=4109 RepID=A0A9J5ZH79_SOLCO|nr:hypothetical protein H5410_023570 [Solanum commersonii]